MAGNRSAPAWPAQRRLMRLLPAAGLCLLLAACAGDAPRTTFDLTAPSDIGRIGATRTQMVVNEATALQPLDTDRILVRDGGALSYLPDAQWSDRLPKLFQVRLIQSFENASRLGRVSRPGDRVFADRALNTDLRAFGIEAQSQMAVVDVTVRIVSDGTGRVIAARGFSARVPVTSVTGPAAAQALDLALSQVLRDIVRWAR